MSFEDEGVHIGHRIQVFRAGLLRRKWSFRFISANNEKVAYGETYSRRIDAMTTARLVAEDFQGVTIETVDE